MAEAVDVESEIDRLYRLPLAEFVEARNALVKRVRGADRRAADRIKALAKPSVSAWAVNQLYWSERAAFDALVEAGDALRAAQSSGGALQAATARRREALAEARRRIGSSLEAAGHGTAPVLLRRALTTLEASIGSATPGRLTADLDPPGFDALSMFGELPPSPPEPPSPPVSPAPPPPASPLPRTIDVRRERARAGVARAEAEDARKREAAKAAAEARDAADAVLGAARREVEEAREGLDAARKRLDTAYDALREAEELQRNAARRAERTAVEAERAAG